MQSQGGVDECLVFANSVRLRRTSWSHGLRLTGASLKTTPRRRLGLPQSSGSSVSLSGKICGSQSSKASGFADPLRARCRRLLAEVPTPKSGEPWDMGGHVLGIDSEASNAHLTVSKSCTPLRSRCFVPSSYALFPPPTSSGQRKG